MILGRLPNPNLSSEQANLAELENLLTLITYIGSPRKPGRIQRLGSVDRPAPRWDVQN